VFFKKKEVIREVTIPVTITLLSVRDDNVAVLKMERGTQVTFITMVIGDSLDVYNKFTVIGE
jgi:hypothetical protein